MKKFLLLTFALVASFSLSAQSISFNQSSLNSFTANVNDYSTTRIVTVQANFFSSSGNMILTANGDFEFSLNQVTWYKSGSLCICTPVQSPFGTKYSLISSSVYVRFAPTTSGELNGSITASMSGITSVLDLSGTASGVTSTVNLNTVKAIAYPNPTKGNIKVEGIEKVTYDFTIVNNLGALVNAGKMENNELDVTNLANGMYTLLLRNGDKKISILFVKN